MDKKGAFIVKCEPEGCVIEGRSKIAAFDFDWTLVKPEKGRWPKSYDDWVLAYDQVETKLRNLHEAGYKIALFTNQSGSKFEPKKFAHKVKNVARKIGVPMHVFGCTEHGYCRKPSVGLWKILARNNGGVDIDLNESFYVGDAYPGAFSNSDYLFAKNIGIDFYTPEDYFESENPLPYVVEDAHPLTLAIKENPELKPSDEQELIILVGPPASGKSTFRESEDFADYVVGCQDDLGTKAKVVRVIRKALADGKSAIVDRKNEYKTYRKEFIEIAEEFNVPVRVFWFDVPSQLSKHLSAYREITTGKHIPTIVFNKYFSEKKGMEEPTLDEGIESITKLGFVIGEPEKPEIFNSYLIGLRASELLT